jgi:hypothetical protein
MLLNQIIQRRFRSNYSWFIFLINKQWLLNDYWMIIEWLLNDYWIMKMIDNITKIFKYFLMILKKILYFYNILKQINIIIISD